MLFSCYSEKSYHHITQDDIVKSFEIEYLVDDTYYFPAHNTSGASLKYQPLKRFDLIFVGHDIQNQENTGNMTSVISSAIPGYYTHVPSYIGKDSDGFAYAVDMNADENMSYTLDFNGLKVGGKIYVYCIGNEYTEDTSSNDEYIYGIATNDRFVANARDEMIRMKERRVFG